MAGFESGSVVGSLQIERELGRGAFGRVYLARDTLIGRQVALKVVSVPAEGRDDGDRNRALKEARAVGGLNSPNIVTLYSVHPPGEGNAWMFEMEYVKGGTLNDLLGRNRSLPAERATEIARGIATALKVAHEGGVVHGDVKPSNVLLHPDGTAKMADFGLARILGDVSLSLSATGQLIGTPVYMSPEVVMGDRPTVASDIWGFGVILYRMLSGRLPFEAANLNSLFFGIQNTNPVPLDEIVPLDLAELAHHCLMKVPGDRPRSCEELVARLSSASPEVSVDPTPTPVRLRVRGRIVGRDRELKRLAERVTAAETGNGSVVLLSGPAGVGKTTLARQVGALAQSRGFRWIESAVMPLEGVLRPLLESLRDVLETEEIADRDSGLFGSAATQVKKLLDEEPGPRLENQAQTVWALEQLLKGLARSHRIAVLLEDAQHADPEDVRLLKLLARYLPESGILFLVTSRSGDRERAGEAQDLAALEHVEHLDLQPLEREDAYRLLEDQAEGARVAPEIAERILSISQGNPFFVVELFRHLRDTGAIVRGNGSLRAAPSFDATSLPSRFRDLVAYRLEGLPEDDRALLDMAAVDGVTFDGEAVASVLERPMLLVLRSLQRIYREHGIIIPSRTGYRFANAVFQEVIYADLAPELRRAIHRQLAGHLEQRSSGAITSGRIGAHWEGAGERARARPYLLQAANEAYGRQEFLRALDYGKRGGVLRDGPRRPESLAGAAETVFNLAHCLANTGRSPEADTLLEELVQAAEAAADETLRTRAAVHLTLTRYYTAGRTAIDERELKRAVDTLPDCAELGLALYLLGLIGKYRSDLREAEGWLEKADHVFRALNLQARHATTVHQLGSVRLRQGRLGEAEALFADAARISAHVGQRANAAASEVNRALAAYDRGALSGLDGILRDAIRTLNLEGARNIAAQAAVMLSEIRYALGDLSGALATAEEAVAMATQTGYLRALCPARVHQAHWTAVGGDLDRALTYLEHGREAAVRLGDAQARVTAAALETQIRCWRGDTEAAERAAGSCLEWARGQESTLEHLSWALLLGEAVLYGLPARFAHEADGLLPPAEERGRPHVSVVEKTLAGIRAWADPDAPAEPLREAAAALAGPHLGRRRATLRVLGCWLDAEAMRRAGDTAGAERAADAALGMARSVGHIWLERTLRSAVG